MPATKIDVRKYLTGKFIKLADVEDKPLTRRIAEVVEGQYDKLDLIFTTGQKLSLNKFNLGRLVNDLGDNAGDWIDHDVKLSEGMIPTQNGDQPGVVLDVVMPETKPAAKPAATKPRGDMDDEIPF
jgi:hypothetical protein